MGLFDSIGKIFGTIVSPLTGPVGPIIGSAFDYFLGQKQADKAFDQSQYASALAYSRDLEMYKNRYHYTVEDMRNAGLNPILAASGGFNVGSTPSYHPPQAFLPHKPDSLGTSAKSLGSAKESTANVEKMKTEMDRNLADAERIRSQKGLITAHEKESLQRTKNLVRELEKMTTEIAEREANISVKQNELEVLYQTAEKIEAEVARLKKIANIYDGPAGQIIAYIETLIGMVPGIGLFFGRTQKKTITHERGRGYE